MRGKIERVDDTTLHISELPIKKWTQDYKQFLEVLLNGDGKKCEPEIKDFQENHTDATVSFTINADKDRIDLFEREKNGLHGKFKLQTTVSTSNMNLFDTEGRIVKFQSPEDILALFYETRLDFYARRKQLLLENMRHEQKMLSNKAKFVEEVCAGDLVVSNRKRTDILHELRDRGYDLINKDKKTTTSDEDDSDTNEDDSSSDAELAKGYEYLLGMKIWSLTYEKAEALRAQLAEKTVAVEELEVTAPTQIWLDDLDAIVAALDERDAEMDAAASDELKAQNKSKKRQAKATKKRSVAAKRGKKKKADEWDSDLEDSSNDDKGSDSDSEVDFGVSRKTTVRKYPALKKKTAALPKKPPMMVANQEKPKLPVPLCDEDELAVSSDDEVEMSLLERMKKNLMVSPASKKPSVPVKVEEKTRVSKKRPSPRALAVDESDEDVDSDSLDDFDTANFAPASVTPARKKAAVKKPEPKRSRGASSTSKLAGEKTVHKQGRSKKKVVVNLDSESDSDEFAFNEGTDSPAPQAARARNARARSKVNYALMEESDSDSDY